MAQTFALRRNNNYCNSPSAEDAMKYIFNRTFHYNPVITVNRLTTDSRCYRYFNTLIKRYESDPWWIWIYKTTVVVHYFNHRHYNIHLLYNHIYRYFIIIVTLFSLAVNIIHSLKFYRSSNSMHKIINLTIALKCLKLY